MNKTVNEIKQSTGKRFDQLETKLSDLESNISKLVTRGEAGEMKIEVKTEVANDFEKIVGKKSKKKEMKY